MAEVAARSTGTRGVAALAESVGRVTGSLVSIYSGHKAKKNAKKLAKAEKNLINEKRKTAEQTYKWNEEEILETFQENYKRMSYDYSNKVKEVVSQKAEASSKITSDAATTAQNVELQGSSFMNSQNMEMEQEFQEATGNLLFNQARQITDMAKDRESQIRSNHSQMIGINKGYNMDEFGVEQKRESNIMNAEAKMMSGALGAMSEVTGLAKEYSNAGGMKGIGASVKNNFNEAKTDFANLFSMDGGKS